MQRDYCQKCKYPLKTCVCQFITMQFLPFKVSILQHKKEASNAKNTAKLAKLVTPSINIITTENKENINALRLTSCKLNTIILFPNKDSAPLTKEVRNRLTINEDKLHLILLDGTWKQANQIWQSNSFLRDFPSIHFNEKRISQYKIRKRKKDFQLSTIEALASVSNMLFNIEMTPYNSALNGLTSTWNKYLPK